MCATVGAARGWTGAVGVSPSFGNPVPVRSAGFEYLHVMLDTFRFFGFRVSVGVVAPELAAGQQNTRHAPEGTSIRVLGATHPSATRLRFTGNTQVFLRDNSTDAPVEPGSSALARRRKVLSRGGDTLMGRTSDDDGR